MRARAASVFAAAVTLASYVTAAVALASCVAAAAFAVSVAGCGGPGAPLTADEVDRACVALIGCGTVVPATRSAFQTIRQCTQALFGINDPARALAASFSPSEARCVGHAGADRGAQAVCVNLQPCAIDCADVGRRCFSFTRNGFTLSDCASQLCSGVGTVTCDGALALTCSEAGFFRVTDCGAQGLTCGTDFSGNQHCTGTGACCDSTPASCDGGAVESGLRRARLRRRLRRRSEPALRAALVVREVCASCASCDRRSACLRRVSSRASRW